MSDQNDAWAANRLDRQWKQIRVLEEQVTALNWILRTVVQVLPAHVGEQWLSPQIAKEIERLTGLMAEAEEWDRQAYVASRNLLMAARDAAGEIVLTKQPVEDEKNFLRGVARGLARVIVHLAPGTNDKLQEIAKWRDGTRELIAMRTRKPPAAGPIPEGDVPQFRGEEWVYATVIQAAASHPDGEL